MRPTFQLSKNCDFRLRTDDPNENYTWNIIGIVSKHAPFTAEVDLVCKNPTKKNEKLNMKQEKQMRCP